MLCVSTSKFKIMVGRCDWLSGRPFGARLMLHPSPFTGLKYQTIPCAWDGWVTRHGFVVNQRGGKEVLRTRSPQERQRG